MPTKVRALVVGAGRMGRAIARDLAADRAWEVTAADRSEESLAAVAREGPVATARADLADAGELARLARGRDLAVGALPGALGFRALEALLGTGTHCVDISFFPEDPFRLDALAREREVTAVVDCGLAPGLDNLILGRQIEELAEVESFACYVGGLPAERRWPWEYKAPFTPADVLEEYLRPARQVEAGRVVTRPALSGHELLEFPEIGTLEAFNTDGLRTLLTTVSVPSMKEKTLRYPGHAEKVRVLRDSGLLSREPVALGRRRVSPLALVSEVLSRAWRLEEGGEDLTVFRVLVEGRRGDGRERRTFEILDRSDPETGLSSMARTTGFTCAALARLVARRAFRRAGVWAPEHVGRDRASYAAVLGDLEARGVRLHHHTETL